MEPSFGIVVPVGPGPQEINRVRDLLETYEPGNFHLVLVDDAMVERGLPQEVGGLSPNCVAVIKNPRNGRGNGWDSGCAAAVLAGLGELSNKNVAFALKLDTDALVIRPFADRIIARFRDNPGVGMLGSRYFAEGSEPDRDWIRSMARVLEKLQRQFAVWRKTNVRAFPALQIALWGKDRKIRDTIRLAFINGFRAGDHCQGGAYALSRACLRGFEQCGHLKDPLLWLRAPIPDDHLLALCVKAIGFHFRSFDQDGEPFACAWAGLPDTPENLVKRGFGIVHSVKDHGDRTEVETRAFFKARRSEARAERSRCPC